MTVSDFFFGEPILDDLFWKVPINYASNNGNANAFFFWGYREGSAGSNIY